ncbi:UNVERIFIED_CONTAM: hypothetical protein Sradi_3323400 [Sesamum radiatum]|uniref:Aminotransferase-like plant mobile domain-containing protein n=1 Tax=Sesamum radiatum TaxID=300843 RepID=A0AAW2R1W1_SESRA
MDFKDRTEPFPSIVIRNDKDKLKEKGTTLFIHESANEWTEDVLSHHENIFHAAKIHAAMHPSLLTYICNKHILQPSFKLWCPSMNTYILPLEKYPSLCGTFMDFVAYLYVESFRTRLSPLPRLASGDVDASNLPRDKDHNEPFTLLQIPEDIRDETYVAAFLSCWLYSSVLPHSKAGKVRASTFIVASRIAHGECFILVVPVLASIYRDLKNISAFANQFKSSTVFPIHYVYGWTGRYLKTHFPPKFEPIEAQMVKYVLENMARHFEPIKVHNLFHCIKPSRILNIHFPYISTSLVADDMNISSTFKDLFVALHSSYLTLRIRVEFIVEAYSPYRFSRQFDFSQDIPGSLNVSSCPLVMKECADWWAKCNMTSLDKNTLVVLKPNHLRIWRRNPKIIKQYQPLVGIKEGVPLTAEGSIGSINGISASYLPKVDVVLMVNCNIFQKMTILPSTLLASV